jgi:hypothetical protein
MSTPTVQQFANEWRFHTDDGDISLTPNQLATDLGVQAVPMMPAGFDQRVYEQGKCHALKVGTDTLDGGPMPWVEGDALLKEVPKLLELRAQRQQAELEAAKAEQQRQLDAMIEEQNARIAEAEASLAQKRQTS